MRLIGTLDDQKKGLTFSLFLNHVGIAHQLEILTNRDWGSHDYGTSTCQIWITDEDQVDDAQRWYDLFLENPNDPRFQPTAIKNASPQIQEESPLPPLPNLIEPPKSSKSGEWISRSMGPMTRALLLGCCFLFFIAQLLTPVADLPPNFPETLLFSSPVEKFILYDYPHLYELIEQLLKLYGYEALQDASSVPPNGQRLIEQINHTPYWQGFYHIVQEYGFGAIKEKMRTVPMFEKIREGQIWRLFSPAFFHANLFHLFFNMLWLVVLGKQLERRLGAWRYIIFILIVAIISNTAQYLMSGPNFVGFSGVLCGMLTFIWMRQRYAPWEGYQLDKATITFMLLFIVLMAVLQFFSFFLEKAKDMSISPGIANMAHLSGAFAGLILGRFNFFSWSSHLK